MTGFLKSFVYKELFPFLHDLMPIGSTLLHGALFCFFVLFSTFAVCWGREKLLARMQMRRSGSLKSMICRGIVGLLKCPAVPDRSQKTLFVAAPLFAFVFSLFFFFFMPVGSSSGLSLDFSMLYFLFTASCGVYAFIVGGWCSSSRFSFFGAVRLIAQSLACQPVLAIVIVTVLMTAGGSDLQTVMRSQKHLWFVVPHFPLFVLYLLSSAMLLAHAPFGSPKSDRELAGGVYSEYSGALYMLFLVSENVLLLLCAAVGSILFLGGTMPLFGLAYPKVWMAVKTAVLLVVLILVKETLPVWKTDRIINISFKTYLPFSLAWMAATAGILYFTQGVGGEF